MKLEITNTTNALRFAGDLDIYGVESARAALLDYLVQSPEPALDLSCVENCDAAGIQLLVSARRSAESAGKKLAVHPSAAAIEKCGELLGLSAEAWQPVTASP